MQYYLRVARLCGKVIPVIAVVEALAQERATCFGTEKFHQPTWEGASQQLRISITDEIRAGRLQVCDPAGFIKPISEIIQTQCSAPDIEFSSSDTTWPGSDPSFSLEVLVCSVTLQCLNAWGAVAGNSFALHPDGREWVDERGLMGSLPIRAEGIEVSSGIIGSAKAAWVSKARTLAEYYLEKWRNKGFEPTGDDAASYVAGIFSNDGTYNTRGEIIDSATIKREALTGITRRKPGERRNGKKIPANLRQKLPDANKGSPTAGGASRIPKDI